MDAPHFWDHQRQAKVVIQRLNEQKFFLDSLEKLQTNHHHLTELYPMLDVEPTLLKSFQQELLDLTKLAKQIYHTLLWSLNILTIP